MAPRRSAPKDQPEEEAVDWMTTAIHVPRNVLVLLRRVAVERANRNGGRASVSAVLVDLVRANAAELEKGAGR
ncbi:hypothetical protein [Roseomonas chloroacetimidivorans]|uniref:hypothetical protein n=1 Tax=Roseomonas chloroacetimidivorans TaxID=1766656 RepID=UPI003C70BE3B